jgi:hypothetical protein
MPRPIATLAPPIDNAQPLAASTPAITWNGTYLAMPPPRSRPTSHSISPAAIDDNATVAIKVAPTTSGAAPCRSATISAVTDARMAISVPPTNRMVNGIKLSRASASASTTHDVSSISSPRQRRQFRVLAFR